MDIAIDLFGLPETDVSAGTSVSLYLELSVELTGNRTLTPTTQPADVYSIAMFLSLDEVLDETDIQVSLHSYTQMHVCNHLICHSNETGMFQTLNTDCVFYRESPFWSDACSPILYLLFIYIDLFCMDTHVIHKRT